MTKLSDYVMRRVAETGVRDVFLLPGGGCMHLVDSLGREKRLGFICNLHEQAAAVAADAYSQYTGNLGVALVTTGPGGTNAITGVVGSWLDSIPTLILSGQVKRPDLLTGRGVRQMGFQEINIIDIVRPITKYAMLIDDPRSVRYHFDKALYLAKHGRPGPVWLDFPLDVQAAELDEATLPGFDPSELPDARRTAHLPKAVEAIRLLNAAERPVILVGNGVRLAGAVELFLKLAEILQIPVLTTWKAMDFLAEDDPLYIGRPGAVAQRAANLAQQNSDCILILGARLDLGQTAYNHAAFARRAAKVIVEVDPAEIAKLQMTIDLPVCGDAGMFIEAMLAQRHRIVPKNRDAWWAKCREWKKRFPVLLPEYWNDSEGVSNYVLVEVLSDEMRAGDLLVPGSSGASSEVTMQAFRVPAGVRVFNTEGLGPMGFGLSAAIGGCVASGGRTVCIDGDGGLQLNIQEFETLHRLNLPLKLFVLNNNGYASIRSTQKAYFDGRYVASGPDSGLTLPDIVKVAAAYGLPTAEIRDHSDIRGQVRRILDQDGPVVCDVHITPNQTTAPRVSSRQRADGMMETAPMEDLWPFLDRDDFAKQMLIETESK
jgi:acetolactate synthase-1/2/3 large subunit